MSLESCIELVSMVLAHVAFAAKEEDAGAYDWGRLWPLSILSLVCASFPLADERCVSMCVGAWRAEGYARSS
jgi:hypothetical protein